MIFLIWFPEESLMK